MFGQGVFGVVDDGPLVDGGLVDEELVEAVVAPDPEPVPDVVAAPEVSAPIPSPIPRLAVSAPTPTEALTSERFI
jgi:hypothetical protein